MEEEQENRGVTIGEIFHVIFSRKWLALIIAAVITLVGTLAIFFGYNTLKAEYVSTFTINFVGSSRDRYPDNLTFDFRDIVSLQALRSVKAGDEQFKDIDVESLYEHNDISIAKNYNEQTSNSSLVDVDYTVSAKATYFANEKQAAAFLDALINFPVTHINEWTAGLVHDANLDNYASAKNFADKLSYLSLQADYIDSNYSSLMSSTELNVDSIRSQYRTVTGQIREIRDDISYAQAELLNKKYIINFETLQNYAERYISLDRQLTTLKGTWDRVFGQLNPQDILDGNFAAEAVSLARQIIDTQFEINDIGEYLEFNGYDGCVTRDSDTTLSPRGNVTDIIVPKGTYVQSEESKEFEARLNAIRDQLKEITDTYGTTFASLHSEAAFIAYEGSQVKIQGTLGLLLSLILSLIVGIIIACIVALIVAMPAYLREKRGGNNAVENAKDEPAKTQS